MANAYQKFLKMDIDIAPLGVEDNTNEVTYFCTPKGASIIGWAGVDGIHYCFIRGFGEMVFAVSPENASPEYVHPLAENFNDFLRLLLACGEASALEQAWMWDKEQFDNFLQQNSTTESQNKILAEIAAKMNLSAMKQPWQYMKNLQSSFDYSKIKYTEDFYDPDMNAAIEPEAPQWKVFFEGNFWWHHGKDHAGKEIAIGKQFEWAGRQWLIPAIYSCSKGLVVDICMRVDPEQIRVFMDKWDLTMENEAHKQFSREQQMEIEVDNPLCLNFEPQIRLNGKNLHTSRGCGMCYYPCLAECVINEMEAKWVIDHYDLDPAYGWMIWRCSFPWKIKRRPEIKTLSLIMEQQSASIPGPHFRVASPGDTFEFVYPKNGTKYTLAVQEYEQQTMPENIFRREDWEYPTHYHATTYTITPEVPDGVLTITDCADSDRPKEKQRKPFSPVTASSVAVMGIIGSADGPTTVISGADRQGKLRAAISSLHFVPVDEVEWHMVFHEKQFSNVTVELI